ncbi:FlgO family outer membrane protein [Acidovorax sp. SDU_ACID1]|uniref:FlgO family outer membrane protein n=1 Tax=Acidovorax sp. SDU_ACID1 TaxID=3136632 RepID=UPI00387395E3
MNRRTMMAALLACGALGGCARYYYGEHAVRDPADLVALHHGAADALLQQVALDPAQPVLVATVVQLDRLDASSRLGRLVSEQVAGRLAQRGLRVTELRLRETLALRPCKASCCCRARRTRWRRPRPRRRCWWAPTWSRRRRCT